MTEEELYAKMPEKVIGVEIPWRYDWIAFYLDEETWQRYSRRWNPIEKDEVCRWGNIYKVEFHDEFGCDYTILSSRPDIDDWEVL